MTENLCRSCEAWVCAESDAYCGQCGTPCATLRLEAFPSVLFAGHHAPDIVFRLCNSSVAAVRVASIALPDWLKWVRPPEGLIPPNGKAVYSAKASTRTLTEAAAGEVSFSTNVGEVAIQILAIESSPELRPKEPVVDFWPDELMPTRLLKVEAIPAAGSLRILSLGKVDQRWLRIHPVSEPIVASATRPLSILTEIDSTILLRSRPAPGSRHAATIEVQYEGPHGPAVTPLHVVLKLRQRPAMAWLEEHAPPVRLVTMARQKLSFTISNRSQEDGGLNNGALFVEAVSLQPPAGLQCGIQPSFMLPATVVGGESITCEFDLDLENSPPCLYHFELAVTSNGPQPKKMFRVPVNVTAVPDYDGIIAIDFGTSNTCCALLETGGSDRDIESIALDDERTTCPTLVRYLDLDGPAAPAIETGAAIKHLAAANDEVAASTVDRLKHQLGERTFLIPVRPKNSREWRQIEVRSAAADYLRLIRQIAEWKRRARFTDFIVTHPAVCSLQQYRNLRLAIEAAFGTQVHIDFLQEPVAALIPFFSEMALDPGVSEYTVASFDLGGGTTDITLVRVKHQRQTDGNLEIAPEILTSWGERFGGEDLTDFLVSELIARCRTILETQLRGFQLADRQVKGSSTPDILRNRAALRQGAERLKAALSEESAAGNEPFGGLLLRAVRADHEQPVQDVRFVSSALDAAGRASLEVVFLSYVRTKVSQLALRLKSSSERLGSLDHIQLSGKTTFLPVVRQVLAQHFSAKLRRAGDPKECVVRGACMSRALARVGRSRRLNLASAGQRTTSSIGLLHEDSQMFRPIIPLDHPIPKEGLEKFLPAAIIGIVPVVVWENLGFELERIRSDGSMNPLLRKLGTWKACGGTDLDPNASYGLRLRFKTDFSDPDLIQADLIGPQNEIVPLKVQGGVL